jgi:hypothetical protein
MPSRLAILSVTFMLLSVILSLLSLIVTFTHSKPSAAPEKTEIVFQCEASWPSSRSQELSPWEIQAGKEYNESGSLVPRDSLEKIVAYWPRDVSNTEHIPGKDAAEDLSTAKIQEPSFEAVPTVPSAGWAFTIGDSASKSPLLPPEMPTYFTRRNCCRLSFPCYNFFLEHSNESPELLSLEWRKGLCCYRQMTRNENCTNPPPPPDLKPMYIAPPPYCVN